MTITRNRPPANDPDDLFADDDSPPRVVPIGTGRRRDRTRPASHSAPQPDESELRSARTRARASRRGRGMSSLDRNVLSIGAAVIAIVVLGYAVWQFVLAGSAQPGQQPGTTAQATSIAGAATATAKGTATEGGAQRVPTPTLASAQRSVKATIKVLEPNYTVVEGDTLGKIALASGNTVESLQGLNKLADPTLLSIGQKLIVPQS